MTKNSMTLPESIRNTIEQEPDLLRQAVQLVVQQLMSLQADAQCGASYCSRSEDRVNQRNGYRTRSWDTRVGTLDLAIPKLRRGTYFPDWLIEPRRRAERALFSVIAESYVLGVSTRRVEKLVQTLGIEGISKSQVSEIAKQLDERVEEFRTRPLDTGPYRLVWLDAHVQKVREGGRIVPVAVVKAIAANADGKREILGMDVITTEDGAGWLAFLRGLVSRGLSGVALVISDAHAGLRNAIASALPGASWQRCRTHFMTNLLARVPKSAQGAVATMVRSIFNQPDAESVRSQYRAVLEKLEESFPRAAELLEEAETEILTFADFPKELWKKIWSNNPLERFNKEVRRRTDVVGIFPNREAIIRLVGSVLAEQHDEWQIARRYVSLDSLAQIDATGDQNQEPEALIA